MNKRNIPTCVLLTSDNRYLSQSAEIFTKKLFKIMYVGSFSRREKKIPEDLSKIIQKGDVDYLFNFLSPIIIPDILLSKVKISKINFHPAPPKWPGIGSASFALFEGDKRFGVTAHHMVGKVDSGPIIQVLEFPILKSESCDSLMDRALCYSLLLFYRILYSIAHSGNIPKSKEKWQRKAITRLEFEKFMTVSPDDSPGLFQRKIHAIRSTHFSGPFINYNGLRFQLPPLSTTKNHEE